MAFKIDEKTGRITKYQDDSFEFALETVPTDIEYEINLSFYDEKGNIIRQEIKVISNDSDTISIS